MRKMSKRTLAVGLPLAVAGIAGVAYAATITVSSTTLGSGDQTVAACNGTASVTYDSTYNVSAGQYQVSAVNLTSAASCKDLHYQVTLTGSDGSSLNEMTGTLDQDGKASPAPTSAVNSADVTGVHVLITGSPAASS